MYVALLIAINKTKQQEDIQVRRNISPSGHMTHDHMTFQADSICEQSIENIESSVQNFDIIYLRSISDEHQVPINAINNQNIKTQQVIQPRVFYIDSEFVKIEQGSLGTQNLSETKSCACSIKMINRQSPYKFQIHK